MNLSELHNFADFEKASLALIKTGDADPVYPFLKQLIAFEKFHPTEACFLYVYFYSLESMTAFLRKTSLSCGTEEELKATFTGLKFGMERGRTPQVRDFNNFLKARRAWLGINFSEAVKSPAHFRAAMKGVPYFGEWASYKMCEVFQRALGHSSLDLPDIGINEGDANSSTGPIFGLRYLYGIDNTFTRSIIPEWNALANTLAARWNADLSEVETCLCKVPKILKKGSYFVGHDIWELSLLKSHLPDYSAIMNNCKFDPALWDLELDHKEVNKLKKAYVRDGILANT